MRIGWRFAPPRFRWGRRRRIRPPCRATGMPSL